MDESGPRLLIVEDDAVFRDVLARALLDRGYRVEAAATVQEASDAAAKLRPHWAILDLKLGKQSSLELVPSLRRDYPDIRILLLTGYASIATAVQAIQLGAQDYLTKPVELDALLAVLAGRHVMPMPSVPDLPSVRRLEWEHIQRALKEHAGNVSAAARALGMHRRTLQRKLAKKPVRR